MESTATDVFFVLLSLEGSSEFRGFSRTLFFSIHLAWNKTWWNEQSCNLHQTRQGKRWHKIYTHTNTKSWNDTDSWIHDTQHTDYKHTHTRAKCSGVFKPWSWYSHYMGTNTRTHPQINIHKRKLFSSSFITALWCQGTVMGNCFCSWCRQYTEVGERDKGQIAGGEGRVSELVSNMLTCSHPTLKYLPSPSPTFIWKAIVFQYSSFRGNQ